MEVTQRRVQALCKMVQHLQAHREHCVLNMGIVVMQHNIHPEHAKMCSLGGNTKVSDGFVTVAFVEGKVRIFQCQY